ncbi:hypothetical protein [Bacteriophage sp.]|nr:hypothetical protein [Bacteriophage sp.]
MAEKQPTQVETVTMKDGRIVEFAGKRRMLKESKLNADGSVAVQLDFRNGETRLFTIPPAMLNKFAAHGAEQKLGDETAGLEDTDDMVLAIDELIDRLYAGEWSVRKEGNGLAGTSVLARALVEVYNKTMDEIRAYLKGKTHAEKLAIRGTAKIKPVVERIEAEKASKATTKVDTDALLAGLE